mmetsp:Transcript_79294/g.175938  ORF Transcript_79294/g.175938 Transcript_79294/m.175938 type:complete len:399 (+) Transcript_79294:2-1198(+)
MGMVVIVDKSASCLTRPNPCNELYRFLFDPHFKGKPCDLCCCTGALSTSQPFSGRSYEFGEFDVDIAQMMLDFNVHNIDAKGDPNTMRAKRDLITRIAESTMCDEDSRVTRPEEKAARRFYNLNRKVRLLGCGPVLRKLAFQGLDVHENIVDLVDNVITSTEAPLGSIVMSGVSGETPLMVASARGNLKVMEILLRRKADPNAEDSVGETPLHYAAMGGQRAAAHMLVRSGAIVDKLSIFEETPSHVARQNPAWFCPDPKGVAVDGKPLPNIRPDEVLRFLEEEVSIVERIVGICSGFKMTGAAEKETLEALRSPTPLDRQPEPQPAVPTPPHALAIERPGLLPPLSPPPGEQTSKIMKRFADMQKRLAEVEEDNRQLRMDNAALRGRQLAPITRTNL